jgi:hypothetical protein
MLKKIVGGVIIAVALSALAAVGLSAQNSPFKPDTSRPLTTQAEYDRWQKEISNWGRWGKDDEMGALNLITPRNVAPRPRSSRRGSPCRWRRTRPLRRISTCPARPNG